MISFLIRKLIPDSQDHTTKVRYAVCKLLGYVGIALNFFLFISKYTIGYAVGSVAIKGDAINNLTDFMSNIISILSFKIAEKPADKEHPYGHERTETIAALFMGMIIVYLGIEMFRQSVAKIIHPGVVHFEWAAVAVLILSICVKLYMYAYNNKYGKIYDSDLLVANALDSRNDVVGTVMVLASTLVSPLIHYDLDGIVGLVVSGIILYSAWGLLKDVINTLLGEAPKASQINEIIDTIMESPMVIDVHDIAIHTYGPKYTYATAHVEVDGTLGLIEVHSEVDRLERKVSRNMGIELVTHVDPVVLDDVQTNLLEDKVASRVAQLNNQWSIQDFRIEKRTKRTHIFFDLIVPYDEKQEAKEIAEAIRTSFEHPENYKIELRLVHPFS
ncbi:cation transporter [Erysipelotrichaceae bacterium RD49]|nr:cation transporter [Erysipelotrichaceae bacterium RD49]